MRKNAFLAVMLTLLVAAVFYQRYESSRPNQLALSFRPFIGHEALVFGEHHYPNPGGPGRFAVRDFRFFISNIRLVGDSEEYLVPESYHLARFDGADGTYVIDLPDIPGENFSRLEFGLGVDAHANGEIMVAGDLDPNSRMAWSWDVGYKFVLFEGVLAIDDVRYPLVYHVGFDENYKMVSVPLDKKLLQGPQPRLNFRVDILRMFDGVQLVDMSKLPNVKFDRRDAKLLADNYAAMLELCSEDCSTLPGSGPTR